MMGDFGDPRDLDGDRPNVVTAYRRSWRWRVRHAAHRVRLFLFPARSVKGNIFVWFLIGINLLWVWTATKFYDRYVLNNIRLQTLHRKSKTQYAISRSLQVAYRLPPDVAEAYAFIYHRDARRYVFDWEWLAATTYVESRFNPTALSPSKAKGLDQLLEPTAEEICRKLDIPYQNNITLWDEPTNLTLGNYYLAEGYRIGHSYEWAVKRFLGGSGFKNFPKQDQIERYYQAVAQERNRLYYIFNGIFVQEIQPF